MDEATLSQKEREGILYFLQGILKENVASLQREIVQRVARKKELPSRYDGDILGMYLEYLASDEAAQDISNPEYKEVLSDDIRESPTPFLNIQPQDTLSEREIAEHPFTRQIMWQSTLSLHPRYKYHLRVHGTDHYITEDPEYARTPLGEWKVVALHHHKEKNSGVSLRLEFADDDEYSADRSAASKIKRITGSEYNWSSFNDEAYTFSRMLFRATPHVSRPYPVYQLYFAPEMPNKKLLEGNNITVVTIVHPNEGTSKSLSITPETTARQFFDAVSRKFIGCKSPSVENVSSFALKVCGLEIYLFANNDLPLLQAPRLARAVRRGKRITLVIVPADNLVLESPVPINLELPRAPVPGVDAVVPSSSVTKPFEIVILSGTIPLERQCPHLRVEAAIYYGGRPLSSYFITHAALPVLSDRRSYVWNSKISFDNLIPYLPRESRVCIAVFSVPKNMVDADASTTDASKSSKSLMELVPATALLPPANAPAANNANAPAAQNSNFGAGGGNSGINTDSGSPSPMLVSSDRNGGALIDSAGGGIGDEDAAGNASGVASGSASATSGSGKDDMDLDSVNDDDDKDEISCVRPVYWTSFPIYNYRSVLISGQHSLQMLKGKANPIGICVHAMNLHESANLRIEIPTEKTIVYSEEDCGDDEYATAAIQEQRKEAENETVSEEDKKKLDKLIETDSLYNLNEAEKAIIWKYRYYLKTKPQSIIKLMLAAPSTDYHIMSEIHS